MVSLNPLSDDSDVAISTTQMHRRQSSSDPTQYREMQVKLIEADEQLQSLRRTLGAKDNEIRRLTQNEQDESLKRANAELEAQTLKESLEKARDDIRKLQTQKTHEKTDVEEYKSVAEKYVTWHSFAQKQLEIMQQVLSDCGQWTEDNRYKLFFAYRELQPVKLSDESVLKLAEGSVLGYKGIEDIESISETPWAPKFHIASTQTDPVSLPPATAVADESMDMAVGGPSGESDSGRPSLTSSELRTLELSDRVKQLESDVAMLTDQLIIARGKARQSVILEEQKADLQNQLNVAQKQNAKLLMEMEQLKDSVSSAHLAQFYGLLEENEAVKAGVKRRRQENEVHEDEEENTHAVAAANYQLLTETLPLITGYHVKINDEGYWEVESVLREDAQFLFQKNDETGELQMIETESSEQLQDLMDPYLDEEHTIPLFLAAVTLSAQNSDETMEDEEFEE